MSDPTTKSRGNHKKRSTLRKCYHLKLDLRIFLINYLVIKITKTNLANSKIKFVPEKKVYFKIEKTLGNRYFLANYNILFQWYEILT